MSYQDPEIRKAYQRAYRQAHKEKLEEYRHAYYRAHRPEILQQKREQHALNPEKRRARERANQQVNGEKIRQKRRAYYAAHRELEQGRECRKRAVRVYRQRHPIEGQQRNHLYHLTHREMIKRRCQAYQAAHPERHALRLAYQREYRRQFPDIFRNNANKRRARQRGGLNDLTVAQWREIQEVYGHRCVYCPPACKACHKKTHKLTFEHIKPIAKGGAHTLSNVVPACMACNNKKYTGPPLVPVQPLLITVAPSKK